MEKSIDQANKARLAAETALRNESLAAQRRIAELEKQAQTREADRLDSDVPSNATTDPGALNQAFAITSPTASPQDNSTSANKKKKKKKKRGGPTALIVSPQPEIDTEPEILSGAPVAPPAPKTEEMPSDGPHLRLLEQYLSDIMRSLNTGNFAEIGTTASRLLSGTSLWDDSSSREVHPSDSQGVESTAESASLGQELDDKLETLESKLSGFSAKFTLLVQRLEEVNANHVSLTHQLNNAEHELKSARQREEQLLDKTRHLESTCEDVEELRDMLRDVGSDLVEAKDKIKEIEHREATAISTKSELEATISTLTKELNDSREAAKAIGDLQSQATIAEARAEDLQNELNENKTKFSSVESELAKVNTELATVSADKNELTAKLADSHIKLRQVERSEKEARERVASIQGALSQKEREISVIRSELTNVQNVKAQLEESLRASRQDLSRVESERRELQQREQNAREETTRSQRDATMYRDKINSLELLRATLTTERNTLTEEVQMKTMQLESTQSTMQNLREQTTEMGHQAREAKERCEALEEELSEAHKLLSERAREAGTMRRLLDEAEGREEGRMKEAREKLEAAIEERDHLEEEITLLRRNNAEGSGELTKALRDKELAVNDLTAKYTKVKMELDDLVVKKKDVEGKLLLAKKDADEANLQLTKLSKSLVGAVILNGLIQQDETTAQSRQLQQERNALKEAAEESQIRVDQLQRTQRVYLHICFSITFSIYLRN